MDPAETHNGELDIRLAIKERKNPLKTPIFRLAALRISTVASAYTENSSFPYAPNVVALTPAALLLLIAGRRKRVPFRIPQFMRYAAGLSDGEKSHKCGKTHIIAAWALAGLEG